jgi:hypothetical protein
VPEVVHDPGSEQLAQRDPPQARVLPGKVEVRLGEIPGPEQIGSRYATAWAP